MSAIKIDNWISRLKKIDSEEHTKRAILGRPLLNRDCTLCKIISEMQDATTDVEFST